MAECNEHVELDSKPSSFSTGSPGCIPLSPQQQSSSDVSSSPAATHSSIATTGEYLNTAMKDDQSADGDEIAWWKAISAEKQGIHECSEANAADPQLQFPFFSDLCGPHNDECMAYWLNLFMGAGDLGWPEL